MYSSFRLLLLVVLFGWSCQASSGFWYELITAHLENLDQRLVQTIRNETTWLGERQRETSEQVSEILQIIKNTSQFKVPQSDVKVKELTTIKPQIVNKPSAEKSPTIIEPRSEPREDFCYNVTESGRYTIKVLDKSFEVYCQPGYIVIQNRYDGSVDFYRNWTEYRNGFGSLDGEFWLGLEKIHWITSSRKWFLDGEMISRTGDRILFYYDNFKIGDENDNYMLKSLEPFVHYDQNIYGGLLYSIGKNFSTYDQDNDSSEENCAKLHHGAWWYGSCSDSNLNGKYQTTVDREGMWWNRNRDKVPKVHHVHGYNRIRESKMLIGWQYAYQGGRT